MAEGLTPGWYKSDDGSRRYWDGQQWLTPERPAETEVPESMQTDCDAVEPTALADDVSVAYDALNAPAPRRRRGMLVAAIIGAVVVVGGGAAWWFGTADDRLEARAIAECESALLGMLKNPTAAVFYDSATQSSADYYSNLAFSQYVTTTVVGDYSESELDEMSARLEDFIASMIEDEESQLAQGIRERVVYGEVDAQNGFGAITREEWACAIRITDGELGIPIVLTFGDEYTLGEE